MNITGGAFVFEVAGATPKRRFGKAWKSAPILRFQEKRKNLFDYGDWIGRVVP
jgi:hypothetical protein